jgi:hypothetical protein
LIKEKQFSPLFISHILRFLPSVHYFQPTSKQEEKKVLYPYVHSEQSVEAQCQTLFMSNQSQADRSHINIGESKKDPNNQQIGIGCFDYFQYIRDRDNRKKTKKQRYDNSYFYDLNNFLISRISIMPKPLLSDCFYEYEIIGSILINLSYVFDVTTPRKQLFFQ